MKKAHPQNYLSPDAHDILCYGTATSPLPLPRSWAPGCTAHRRLLLLHARLPTRRPVRASREK